MVCRSNCVHTILRTILKSVHKRVKDMDRLKAVYGTIIAIIITVLFSFSSYAGTWEEKEGELYFYDDSLGAPHWVLDYGYWYYVLEDGRVAVGDEVYGFYFNDEKDSDIPYGAMIEEDQVIARTQELDDFSYLEIERENKEYKKIIIMLPDLGGEKESLKKYGCKIAANNNLVLIPDLYAHDDSDAEAYLPEIIEATSDRVEKLISEYDPDEEKEIDLFGYSVGGMVGYYYICQGNRNITTMSLLASTPDFASLEDDVFYYSYVGGEPNELGIKEEIREELQEMSPFNNAANLKDTNIYMLNYNKDDLISYHSITNFINTVRPEMNLHTKIKHKSSHDPDEESYNQCINYLLGY